jgi:hypothetical protein
VGGCPIGYETDPIVDQTGEAPLWACPSCGHRFVTRNLWHSCSRHDLDELFARAEPFVRDLFDRWVALVERCGPIVVIAQKTRIVFMVRTRFAGAQVRRDRLIANIALPRRVEHPRWTRIEAYGPRWIAHRFDIRRHEDLDDPELAALACESRRELGEQASLRRASAT